ncbi:MAG: TonB-dependent receptor plug domain-containing protein [candidate division Zixibacteria bacterium]|nr:TonB-dependent receptor plug domain-containing protein [candidate division Zixibacteria bacterium]
MKSKFLLCCLVILAVAAFTAPLLHAGTSGKIAGAVYNADTDEELPGTTIRILELNQAVPCDADGEFYFINVPVGTYTLEAILIGYQSMTKTNVRVLVDLTTPVDFYLVPSELSSDSTVVVVAERELVQQDVSYSENWMTREEIIRHPNSTSVDNLIANMAGAVVDGRGNLHLRGGRDGTITYYFDDVPVQDPFTGTAGTRISPEALEELSVVSGGYLAEYGEALSGVVNALTREGGETYSGKLKLTDGLTKPYDVNSAEFGKLKRNSQYTGVFNLGGPIPGLFNALGGKFFSSSEYRDLGGYLPHNRLISFSQASKITLNPSPKLKLNLYGNYYRGQRERYDHRDVNDVSYDLNLDGLGMIKSKSYRWGTRATYTHSPSLVFNLQYNHFYTETKVAPEHLFDTYWTEWPGYSEDENGVYNGTIDEDNYNPDYIGNTGAGFTEGDDFYPYYSYRKNAYDSFEGEIISQIDKYNQFKFGLEYRFNDLKWDNKQFFNSQPYGEKYDVEPRYAAGYIQDKIELGYMILNAGIRADYLNAAINYWEDPVTKTTRGTADPKFELSPRFGISHPIASNTVIHFNYGYFYQVPLYTYMYTNLQAELNSGFPIVGNPDMEPEKTVAYEFGLNHAISSDMTLKVTSYYKDVSNLTSTRLVEFPGGSYTYYTNADYGSVKGVDIVMVKHHGSSLLAGSLNYSYMIAKGNASYATEGYYDYFTQDDPPVWPDQEYPLAFDQRHKLALNLDLAVPRGYKFKLFGMNMPSAWGLNTILSYGSGMPYTKTDNLGNRIGPPNSGRLPAYYRVDLRFVKDFYLGFANDTRFSFFVEVENLFDRRNVINVYSNTGLPDNDGQSWNLSTEDQEEYNLLENDPQNFDTPRTIRWGFEYVF